MVRSTRQWSSVEEIRKGAEAGDPEAQRYLGVCFQTGQGMPQDNAEAVRWFRLAGEQNDPEALCYLGVCH